MLFYKQLTKKLIKIIYFNKFYINNVSIIIDTQINCIFCQLLIINLKLINYFLIDYFKKVLISFKKKI